MTAPDDAARLRDRVHQAIDAADAMADAFAPGKPAGHAFVRIEDLRELLAIARLEGGGAAASPERAFFEWAMQGVCWDGVWMDGGDVQDKALELGLIEKHPEPYDPERHGEVEGIEPGDVWYRFTDRPTPPAVPEEVREAAESVWSMEGAGPAHVLARFILSLP